MLNVLSDYLQYHREFFCDSGVYRQMEAPQ